MSTDRELLKLAAKAARMPRPMMGHEKYGLSFGSGWWNPLTDDGDRLRLARKLGINIDFADCCAWKRLSDHSLIQEFWGGECGDEAHAVLRVAAEIGKQSADGRQG